jgi:hypothetical protein
MILLALLAAAAAPQAEAQPPQRIRSVGVAAGQDCPASTTDEVVVCYDNSEPYRIPKSLRRPQEVSAANGSWVNRAATIDEVSRWAGGLPNTCSAIGTGGATGCMTGMLRQWAAERTALRRAETP